MIITFLGHSELNGSADTLKKALENTILKNAVKTERLVFYCGGYGDFDRIALEACHSIKRLMPDDNRTKLPMGD